MLTWLHNNDFTDPFWEVIVRCDSSKTAHWLGLCGKGPDTAVVYAKRVVGDTYDMDRIRKMVELHMPRVLILTHDIEEAKERFRDLERSFKVYRHIYSRKDRI